MGFNPPVPQRDSDWEIRAVLLLSLFFQVLLIFVGPIRKQAANPLPRFVCWSCYLLADWVADLALGLLVNNLGNIGGNASAFSSGAAAARNVGRSRVVTTVGGGSPAIFAFWTPFLLLHLGGPDTITAYSVEDTELWLRHLIGLVFQLFSACVVFSCSLAGNPMIPATVLVFVVGIIKYAERTYSLYYGSVDGVLANLLPAPNPGPNYARLMSAFRSKQKEGLSVQVVTANGEAVRSRVARDRAEIDSKALADGKTLEEHAYDLFALFRRVCYDINIGHRERKISQAFFLDRRDMNPNFAVQVTELELNFMYDMVHTKEPVAHTLAGCILRFICSACIVSSLLAFYLLDKAGIRRVDVDITYALLLGALALDVASMLMFFFWSTWTLVVLQKSSWSRLLRLVRWIRSLLLCLWPVSLRRWSERTSHMNLIGYCLGRRLDRPLAPALLGLAKLADRLGARRARDIFDDIFFVRRETLRSSWGTDQGDDGNILLEFIFTWLKDAAHQVRSSMDAKSTYEDVEAMRKACSNRGEKAVNDIRDKISEETWDILMDSVMKRDFDESLLMWHIATDLCSLATDDDNEPAEHHRLHRLKAISKTLSEYMLYLLVKQPKVLATSAGVGKMAYEDTCAETKRLFESAAMWDPDHEDAKRMLLGTCTSVAPELVKGGRSKSVLFPACIIAKELRKIRDKTEMWTLVAGVWMEMLTYAAAKCKGTTHLHQLARGGELISHHHRLAPHGAHGHRHRVPKEVG